MKEEHECCHGTRKHEEGHQCCGNHDKKEHECCHGKSNHQEKHHRPTLDDQFPNFEKKIVEGSLKEIQENPQACVKTINQNFAKKDGKWLILFWYPMDFSSLCPTEIIEFSNQISEFEKRNTIVMGASTDSECSHLGWREHSKMLNDIKIPLLADTSKSLASKLGILTKEDKIAYRVTYIIDNKGVIRYHENYPLNIGRDISATLRVLDALQTGGITPCNWRKEN